MNEDFLHRKLEERKNQNAFRRLRLPEGKIDLCSNDYLGIATRGLIEKRMAENARPHARTGADSMGTPDEATGQTSGPGAGEPDLATMKEVAVLQDEASFCPEGLQAHGSTGSRLLAGNYALVEEVERELAVFHAADAGLIFNSGYDANLGLLSAVPQRGDMVLYDALSHASIRDGIRLGFAQSHSFRHNNCEDLERRLQMQPAGEGTVFVVTESVFSMDGDQAPLAEMAELCKRYGARLIVDEAHATGVVGPRGEGLVQELGLERDCFARVHTFGKAVGCHGAVVLGSIALRDFLINFSRSFIYTTALPPSSVAAIRAAYALFPGMQQERARLQELIRVFQDAPFDKLPSLTPIQAVLAPGNEHVRALAESLQNAGIDCRPILYPTVPRGAERLRIVLHAFNTFVDLQRLIDVIQKNKPAHP